MKAYNNYVWIIRDIPESEKNNLIVPTAGRTKPSIGTAYSVGVLVKDGNLKNAKGKKIMFHPSVGWEIEYEGQTYVICEDHQIIGGV
jgi:co-chaperonin GroES (HSP10)